MSNRAKRLIRGIGLIALAGGAAAVLRPKTRSNEIALDVVRDLRSKSRYGGGKIKGIQYRMRGGQPDPNVEGNVLADRIRSTIGPLEKRLDIPRVHVMVEDHVALLHGEVGSLDDAEAIELAVSQVSGVLGVESYLHIGLPVGDARPSAGRAAESEQPSSALLILEEAARNAGASRKAERASVRAVLSTLAEILPEGERSHLLSHLPADVRRLAEIPRRRGRQGSSLRKVGDLVLTVAENAMIDSRKADAIVESVFAALRELVPEEVADIKSVLPSELRELWESTVPH